MNRMKSSNGFWASLFAKDVSLDQLPFETDMHSHVLPGVDVPGWMTASGLWNILVRRSLVWQKWG